MRLCVTDDAPSGLSYPYTGALSPGDEFDVDDAKAEALLDAHDYLREADVTLDEGSYEVVETTDADDDGGDEDDTDMDALTKSELYDLATEAGIEGRSTMSKDELIDALSED